jgi:hypothetical protein
MSTALRSTEEPEISKLHFLIGPAVMRTPFELEGEPLNSRTLSF